MHFQLREFQTDDSAAINEVALAAFEQYRDAYNDWPTLSRRIAETATLAETSEMVVATLESGTIVGAVAYVGPGKPKHEFYSIEWPIVRMLVVSPQSRGLGIGRALTEECIRRAERDGAPLIALHTTPMMKVALPMYERMGFVYTREAPPVFGVPYGIYVKQLNARNLIPLGAV